MNPNSPKTPSEDAITERARALWKAAGGPEGQDLAFWLNAQNKLRDELAAEYDPYNASLKSEAKPVWPPTTTPPAASPVYSDDQEKFQKAAAPSQKRAQA